MRASRKRLVITCLLLVGIVFSGCQGASSSAQPKENAAPQASSKAAIEPTPLPDTKNDTPKASGKPTGAVPTSLPKTTQEYLTKLKMDPSALAGLDDELNVPQEWIDGAKKEGKLLFLHTIDPDQAEAFLKPFKERYPFIQIQYTRGSDDQKVKAITASMEGHPIVDMIIGVGGHFFLMKEGDLNLDLRNLPTWNNVPDGFKDPEGLWVGIHVRHWTMAYNTNKVKKEDLPQTWDDLLTNPVWRNGNLALGNRSQLWMLPLWRSKGEQWAKDYMTKLFTEVKPQLRNEGNNALLDLLAAGEFNGVIPAAEYRVHQSVVEGAPISWWTPAPIPLETSELTIMKKSPNVDAARLFANWVLSKEGQVAQYISDYSPPVHKDMQNPELLPFADLIIGKQRVLRQPEDEENIQPTLLKFWEQLWLKGGGKR